MFTGIITDVTTIADSQETTDGLKLTFQKPKQWNDLQLGESVNTNGVCLTVAAIRQDEYDCLLMPETLTKTSFGQKLPDTVNLERSLTLKDRFGGHFVQGHVDETGRVIKVDDADGYRLSINFGTDNQALVIYKGSITINGVSLTVAAVDDGVLEVALIPHTLQNTTIGGLRSGDIVNLEFDVLGKYVVNSMKVSH